MCFNPFLSNHYLGVILFRMVTNASLFHAAGLTNPAVWNGDLVYCSFYEVDVDPILKVSISATDAA